MIWFPPPTVLVRIASNVPAAIFGPNGIIRSSPTSFASKRMMLMIAAKIKLKNSDNSESSPQEMILEQDLALRPKA